MGSKEIMGRTMSDNRGLLIGSVVSYDSQHGEASIRLLTSLMPEQGDGLVFMAPGQELGMVVHKPILRDGLLKLKTPERVRPGAKVYLTSSNALSRRAKDIITRPLRPTQNSTDADSHRSQHHLGRRRACSLH